MANDAQRLFGQQDAILRHRALAMQFGDVLHQAHEMRRRAAVVLSQLSPCRDPAHAAVGGLQAERGVVAAVWRVEKGCECACLGITIFRDDAVEYAVVTALEASLACTRHQ